MTKVGKLDDSVFDRCAGRCEVPLPGTVSAARFLAFGSACSTGLALQIVTYHANADAHHARVARAGI